MISLLVIDNNYNINQASRIGDLMNMIRAIAYGADINFKNEKDDYRSSLHIACNEVTSKYQIIL